jgi:hypothetical protein
MAQVVAKADQQKDDLCGPFCAARILNVDQDLVALEAGTHLPAATEGASVPNGARSRTDYRYELPKAPPAESGTSPAGLIKAIESLSGGTLRCVPLHGKWTAERVEALVHQVPSLSGRLIANIRTGKLRGSRASAEELLAELNGQASAGPPPDWDVGHFVELTMLIRGPKASLVVVHDTYPTLGLDGYHLQPPRAVAAALERGDGREGGILAVASADQADAVAAVGREIGLEVAAWDNGCRS